MTIEELKEFLWNEQKVNPILSLNSLSNNLLLSIIYPKNKQTLSLTEVEDLVKRFDQSTEGKECSEMGVDGNDN